MPPQTPESSWGFAAAHCGAGCLGLSRLCPAPTLWFSLRPVQTGAGGGDAKGPSGSRPPERQAGEGCPVFGTSSSLSLGNRPTHPHEHQKDINRFIELLLCSRLPLSAMPCRQRACQNLTGAPGRFLAITPVAAFVPLSKGAPNPKVAVGKVRAGQGKPRHVLQKKWLGPKRSHQPRWLIAQVNSDTDPN